MELFDTGHPAGVRIRPQVPPPLQCPERRRDLRQVTPGLGVYVLRPQVHRESPLGRDEHQHHLPIELGLLHSQVGERTLHDTPGSPERNGARLVEAPDSSDDRAPRGLPDRVDGPRRGDLRVAGEERKPATGRCPGARGLSDRHDPRPRLRLGQTASRVRMAPLVAHGSPRRMRVRHSQQRLVPHARC